MWSSQQHANYLPGLVLGDSVAVGASEYSYFATYRAGEVVASSYDEAPFYGIINRGAIMSSIVTPKHRTYITGLQFEGQLLQPLTNGAGIARIMEAATDVSLSCFRQEVVAQLFEQRNAVGQTIWRLMLREQDYSRDWIALLGRRSVEEKLAGFLLLLARRAVHRADRSGSALVEIPLKRSQVAEFLGITLESVSRSVTALKRSGVIRLCDMRHFEVLKPARLAELAGE